jgi:hypothetical protein
VVVEKELFLPPPPRRVMLMPRFLRLLLISIFFHAFEASAQGNTPGQVTWRSIGPGEFGAMFGVAISPLDPQVIVAGLDMGNAFLTRDGGESWKIIGGNGGEP